MKTKIIAAAAVLLFSCTSFHGNSSTRIYSKLPENAAVHLRSIELEPSHILDGISDELPALIYSCLEGAGFRTSDEPGDGVYELDVFLHMKNWQHDYSSRESVTLRLSLSDGRAVSAYRLYTEDTDMSIDSFSWTFSLIDSNIKELFSTVYDEE